MGLWNPHVMSRPQPHFPHFPCSSFHCSYTLLLVVLLIRPGMLCPQISPRLSLPQPFTVFILMLPFHKVFLNYPIGNWSLQLTPKMKLIILCEHSVVWEFVAVPPWGFPKPWRHSGASAMRIEISHWFRIGAGFPKTQKLNFVLLLVIFISL